MTTATMNRTETARERALTTLRFARDMFNKGLKDFPESKLTFQCSPHDNHLAWTLGHLATTYVWLTGLVGGKAHTLPESYSKLFGMECKPLPDAKAYPPLAELKRHSDAAFDAFVKSV